CFYPEIIQGQAFFRLPKQTQGKIGLPFNQGKLWQKLKTGVDQPPPYFCGGIPTAYFKVAMPVLATILKKQPAPGLGVKTAEKPPGGSDLRISSQVHPSVDPGKIPPGPLDRRGRFFSRSYLKVTAAYLDHKPRHGRG